jgi:hypothetical protein
MTPDQSKQLRADFASWSGGFEPESEQQIDEYIEGSLGVDLDADEARMDLMLWMQELNAD